MRYMKAALILVLIMFVGVGYVIRERKKTIDESIRVQDNERISRQQLRTTTVRKQLLIKMSGKSSAGGKSKPFSVTKDAFKVSWESDSVSFKAELFTFPGNEQIGTFTKPEGFGHDIQGGSQDFQGTGQYYIQVTSDAHYLVTAEQLP